MTGCFFIKVFLINYGKILKFSIVELEKRNGTRNDREKNRFLGSAIILDTFVITNDS